MKFIKFDVKQYFRLGNTIVNKQLSHDYYRKK